MPVDRITPEAIAIGLLACAAFGFLSIAAQVFPSVRIAIAVAYLLLGAIGGSIAYAKKELLTFYMIVTAALIGTITGALH